MSIGLPGLSVTGLMAPLVVSLVTVVTLSDAVLVATVDSVLVGGAVDVSCNFKQLCLTLTTDLAMQKKMQHAIVIRLDYDQVFD